MTTRIAKNKPLSIITLLSFSVLALSTLPAQAAPKAAEHVDAPVTQGADTAKPKHSSTSAKKSSSTKSSSKNTKPKNKQTTHKTKPASKPKNPA